MIDLLSEDDAIAATAGLTRDRLITFIAAEMVSPQRSDAGPVYRRIDIARLHLLCELTDDLDLDEHALGIVISLIDQLHDARFALRTLADAFAAAPDELRSHMNAALSRIDA
jgi:chaperone modulatory protein CbpM